MPEASGLTYMEGAVEGGADDWGEVVTRQPYRKVRLDHLLSKEQKLILFKIDSKEIYYHAHCLVLSVLKKYIQGVEFGTSNYIKIWAHSSDGQSARLISVRSMVRFHLSPPKVL